ncbi:Asp-tRNA(Asn)/Glu-tRNA(Gln) amidotransferase subunit GatA [Clostridiisalibacter paucivorans]|uniref:Asp-tRNA(Asn)/Glu-tRNA(Gln) amidotransferase subunit GatA n=1 Tax=Clostridiisalibacter paucivorans TaxID=408753 RepID=UPI00047D7EE4|nr:Asp-tRNA(Asn)/Glu-tRNA(Gln) amidotransferase subunit GatA [Clostridiisalibacter paucivorans]
MDIYRLSISEMGNMLRNKEISSEELVSKYLDRLEELEDKVSSFITLRNREEIVEEAREIDRKISNGEELPPLAGVPVAIKDNIATKGIKTTCASKILENFVPPYDATIIKKLKAQGAIIVGKTNMDEFAMGSSTENSTFKTTKNPWALDRVPGGSSGGSAAAVAAGQIPYALGSSTGGSIRQPASFCGIVGLKPTYGLISRYGLVAFASSLDQIGPLTRNVEDCAVVLDAITGHDVKDSTSVGKEKEDYLSSIKGDIKGMKIALPKEYFAQGINEEIKAKVLEAVKVLEGLGAEVEEVSLPYTDYGLATYYIIAPAEASSNLARFDGVRYGKRAEEFQSIEELFIKTRSEGFGEEVKRRIMVGTYCLSSGYYDAYYKRAQKVRTLIKNDFENVFKKYDVIVSPTSPILPFKVGEKADDPMSMYMSDVLTVCINLAGIPSVSIPCGMVNGLPVGMQIIGNVFDESKILKVAYNYEKNSESIGLPAIGGEDSEL